MSLLEYFVLAVKFVLLLLLVAAAVALEAVLLLKSKSCSLGSFSCQSSAADAWRRK